MGIRFTSDIGVELVQKVGGDHMVVAAARVSTSGGDARACADLPADEQYGLIRYLMRHRHGTPFEHASMTFFVHAPAFVWWEWVRHRIGHSFNLESGRYKKLEPVFWVPRTSRKMFPVKGFRSARPEFEAHDDVEAETVVEHLKDGYESAHKQYEYLTEHGVANEVARAVLPFAIYYSGWVTLNPRSLMAFLSLRTREDDATFVSYPQAEIEEAARACEKVFAEGWPLTHKAFEECGRVAP